MSVYCEFCGQPTEFMTTAQVGRLLGIAKPTVLAYIREGRFPGTTKEIVGSKPQYRIPTSAVLPLAEERAK